MKKKTLGALALALTLSLTVGMLYACAAPSQENPIAENLELKTYRGVSVGGQLKAGFALTHLFEDYNGIGRLHELHIPTFVATRAVKPNR